MLAAELDEGSFDLVHERLVLINVPESDRRSIVAAMLRLARPGGILAVESWDRASHVCHPEHPAWRILDDAYREAVRATNGDGTSGRTLPWLLRSAGVAEVRTKVHVRAVEVGDRRRPHRLGILEVEGQDPGRRAPERGGVRRPPGRARRAPRRPRHAADRPAPRPGLGHQAGLIAGASIAGPPSVMRAMLCRT